MNRPGVRVDSDDAVATVTLSNPAKLNAITVAMWRELAQTMRDLSAREELRCIVIRGAGKKAFAAGADIEEFARERNNVEQGKRYHRQDVFGALKAVDECRHPTVAMIHGACVGGGLEIACMCDLRISGTSGRFGVPINRLGFSIAYDELAALLPLVGRAVALEILVEGRVWSAREAYKKGLVNRVVPDARLAGEVAATTRRILESAPLANRAHKKMIRRLAPALVPPTDAEIDESFAYFNTEDYRIGYDAFLKKKKPKFVGK